MTKDEALMMAIDYMSNLGLSSIGHDVLNACKEALNTNSYYVELIGTGGSGGSDASQEPFAWMNDEGFGLYPTNDSAEPLYTHPKQWQGLSEDEIAKLTLYSSEYTNNDGLETISLDEKHFVKAIEQVLKEKNNA